MIFHSIFFIKSLTFVPFRSIAMHYWHFMISYSDKWNFSVCCHTVSPSGDISKYFAIRKYFAIGKYFTIGKYFAIIKWKVIRQISQILIHAVTYFGQMQGTFILKMYVTYTEYNFKWLFNTPGTKMVDLSSLTGFESILWRTRIVCFKSNLLLSIQMYNTSLLHKYN